VKTRSSFYYRRSRTFSRAERAFSLIEVLVVTGLLSVIIFGLVLMFGQTQRAFKLGTTQVDVLEGGRMVTDMLTREVAQMSPTREAVTNCAVLLRNFNPMVQALPGTTAPSRTNLLMEFFFLCKENQTWSGIGYTVLDPVTGAAPQGGMGTLYRYSTNAFYGQWLGQLFDGFGLTPWTNMSRILDGVVHFNVRTFNPSGDWITGDIGFNIYTNMPGGPVPAYPFDETPYLYFRDNAAPASVEIELGILEAKTAERARSISDNTARANFLAQQASKVHVFRWRVPVRNVDPTAYQ
jgi:hypothetical protein